MDYWSNYWSNLHWIKIWKLKTGEGKRSRPTKCWMLPLTLCTAGSTHSLLESWSRCYCTGNQTFLGKKLTRNRIHSLCPLFFLLTLLFPATACRKTASLWLCVAPSASAKSQTGSPTSLSTHSERDNLEKLALLARTAQFLWGFDMLLFQQFSLHFNVRFALPISHQMFWYHVKIPRSKNLRNPTATNWIYFIYL